MNSKDYRIRQQLAMTAAKIMAEEGVKDYLHAKRKAATRMGATNTRNLPRNDEIEQALYDYHRLFKADTQPQHLRDLRQQALQAMTFFRAFKPRLVGSVVSGTADHHSDINLHLFADTPEELGMFLIQENVPYQEAKRKLRFCNGDAADYPVFRFLAGEVALDLTVFPLKGLRQAPCGPVDGRPMRRVSVSMLEQLLQQSDA